MSLLMILKIAGVSLQFGLASGVTLLDMLAYVLKKGIDFSTKLSIWVYRLISRIMSALGLKVAKDINISVIFIRHIFRILKERVDSLVQFATRSIFNG